MKKMVYIASPLFTREEKDIIEKVAAHIEHTGEYQAYMPHQNGAPEYLHNAPNDIWARVLFMKDKEAIDCADAVVCIYYGMNSDSGTAWEVGYAYATGKRVVIYHYYDTKDEQGSLMICNGSAASVCDIEEIYPALIVPMFNPPYQS